MDLLMMMMVALLLAWAPAEASTEPKATNVVHAWMNETQATAAALSVQGPIASKFYAMTALAMHEALSAGGAPPPALAALAAHTVLAGSFPWLQGKFDMLLGRQLADVPAPDKRQAAEIAVPIAAKILKSRTGDESTRWAMFKPAAPGTAFAYQLAPGQMMSLVPQLGQTTPFKLTAKERDALAGNTDPSAGPVFRPQKDFGAEYREVLAKGSKSSKDRAQYDTDSAFFWAAGANTSAIPGFWLSISRQVLPADMSLEDTALFYARAATAAYDAAIVAYRLKYLVLHHRPITAFRSGLPGFTPVPDWEPLLPTPPHPEYPSGHTAAVWAIADTLVKTLGGKDDVTFTFTSESTPAITRTYKSISAAAKEVGDSRMFAGLHFRSSNEDGARLGRLVASKVFGRITAGKPSTAAVASEKGTASGRRLLLAA